jgi:hypothetical protein
MSPRSFCLLALATAASIGLAVHAVAQRDAPLHAAVGTEALFPGLIDRLNEIREVRVTLPDARLTVTAGDGGWQLAEKAGYPVDPGKVRDLALALANLQLVEAKTADPDRLGRLDLQEPTGGGGSGRLVELVDGSGAPLAAAVVGKPSPSLYGGGRGGVYVRRAGDGQAWLAAGEVDLPADAMGLIDGGVIDLAPDQVARVVLRETDGRVVTLSRPDVAADFVADVALPDGRRLDPVKVEALAGALAGLSMTDVRPAADTAAGADARTVRFEAFAGGSVEVVLTVTGEGEAAEHWLEIRPAGKLGADAPTDQTPAAAGRIEGWAFRIPPYAGENLRVGLDQLLAAPDPAS